MFEWGAWQPLTGGGISKFSTASGVRTLVLQTLFSGLITLVLVWSLRHAWFPAVRAALPKLPNAGAEIREGKLAWPDTEAVLLAERPQFSLSVNPTGTGDAGRAGDLRVEFRPTALRLEGLLGHQEFPYPADFTLSLDRTGASAAWLAWNWPILALLLMGGFLIVWLWVGILASVAAIPGLLLGWILGRQLTLGGAWKMGIASAVTGWCCLSVGSILYATSWIRLPGLAIAVLSQPSVAALGFIWATLQLPRAAVKVRGVSARNPFQNQTADRANSGGGSKRTKTKNPFR
jgi:hypothetical protein